MKKQRALQGGSARRRLGPFSGRGRTLRREGRRRHPPAAASTASSAITGGGADPSRRCSIACAGESVDGRRGARLVFVLDGGFGLG
eukprot:15748602-Heterocapsa_arctica.AAC.1